MLRPSIILAALLFVTVTIHSQPSWHIDKLGVEQGLSEGNVYVIHQDKKGFIWIGTHGGLHRYDGYGFKIFQYTPFNFSTLGDNAVFFLKEDNATGKFWIGGSSCLNEFDPETFTNKRYYYEERHFEFADGVFVNDHEMVLACEDDVVLFDTREKRFEQVPVYDQNNNRVSLSRVENVSIDKKRNVMIMSRTGVFFYDRITKTCRRKTAGSPDFSAFDPYEVFNVMQDRRGYYWIATNKKGVIHFDPVTRKATTIRVPAPFKNESLRFDMITEDSRGKIWAGSSGGLFQIDPDTRHSDHLQPDARFDALLGDVEVNMITEDRNNFIWVGTVGSGVFKMIPIHSRFRNFTLYQQTAGAKTGTYIMGIQQLHHDIWFINIWDQVGKVNMENRKITMLERPLLPDGYRWYSEGAVLKTDKDKVTVLNGEFRHDISQHQDGSITVNAQASPGLSHLYNGRNKTWYFIKAPTQKTFCRNDTIYGNQFFYDAVEDNAGNIWIGSSRGLIQFNSAQNEFTHYRHNDADSNSISSDFIYGLEIDDEYQHLWMATYNGGLCSYTPASGTFRHYSMEDGLSDNTVYSIEKDHHGNLWFSSNTGISTYNTRTGTFRNYGVADGLLNQEFNRRSSFRNEEGWLFFGGISGIDYFHPDSIVKSNTIPQLAFTNFRIFNTDLVPDQKGSEPILELKPDDHNITVEFATLDYNNLQKIHFAYRINATEWIKIGNQHVLSFSNLAPGRHHLYVRCTDGEGAWLDNGIACQIIVQPWWWQTWWFKTGIALLGIGLLGSAIRFYYQRKLEKQKVVLERQQAVEKERTRIATDMHDDLGASLSRIKFLSETIAIKKQKEEGIEEEISSIRHYSHEMIDKMGEIVWALNEKNDSLSDLLAYTRAYAVEYLSQNGIQSSVQTPEQIPDVFIHGEFRRNVYLTVKEALHNIVKHAQASKADIHIETGNELLLRIHDNGKGFNESDIRPYSNGLANMKKRIAALGGSLDIENTDGSTITVTIPIPLTKVL